MNRDDLRELAITRLEDARVLVGMDIEGGERLLNALDEAESDVRVALWIYLSEPDEWRFMIALPLVDQEGPKKAYTLVQSELAKLDPASEISLRNISAVGLEHHTIQALRTAVRGHPGMMDGRWFTRTAISGVFIEAAFVYRVK